MSDGTANTDGEPNNDNAGHANNSGDGGSKEEFTPTQQKLVDDLIGKAFGKGITKSEANNKEALATLNAKISELEANKGKNDDKGKNEDLTAMKEGLEALTKELNETKVKAARESLKSIAAEQNAINSEQVSILIAPFIKYDGSKTSIVNSDGQTRFNSEGKEMTLTEFVKEFLGANPHLVKASNNNGSGSGSSKGKGGGASDIAAMKKMSPTERITYARQKGIK